MRSPSAWGCGLKRGRGTNGRYGHRVTLCVRVWIETVANVDAAIRQLSPSAWGCGLKRGCRAWFRYRIKSPSAWGCGLKHLLPQISLCLNRVTLCVRVWIETCWGVNASDMLVSPSAWGCGLKLSFNTYDIHNLCHPLREGVDWNTLGERTNFSR